MESYLLAEARNASLQENIHHPDELVRAGRVWVHAAGRFELACGRYALKPHAQWVWLAFASGEASLVWDETPVVLRACEMCFLPAGQHAAELNVTHSALCLYIALDGEKAPDIACRLGAPLDAPMPHRLLPSELDAAGEIVRAVLRRAATPDASYQIAQLLYGLLAAHWGLPAFKSPVSREIARVVDALRANQYRDNLTLAEMAQIASMPAETFRKRFLSEMGLPPGTYLLHCKMERAKVLLRSPGITVGQAGAEIGMHDPYRFSKQFKNVVGISPSVFMQRTAAVSDKG